MHESSYFKMKSFLHVYAKEFPSLAGKSRILEVGSKSYEGQPSYSALIDPTTYSYTGLDLEPGLNVDIVSSGAYVWPEIDDESFDVCISGQTFEHNSFFWVTICEIARVLVPGGFACIIAPGAGHVHRYPVDCWRFYPDAWSALCALSGLEILETYFEDDEIAAQVSGGIWRDSMMIARKNESLASEAAARRASITEPFRTGFGSFEPVPNKRGPGVAHYLRAVPRRPVSKVRAKLAHRLCPSRLPRTYTPAED